MRLIDPRSSFGFDALSRNRPWLDGRVLTGTFRVAPRLDEGKQYPAILADTLQWNAARSKFEGKAIGAGHAQYVNDRSNAPVQFHIEIEDSVAGNTIVDLLAAYGPGPGTVLPVVDREGHLLAFAVKPGGDEARHAH